MPSELELTILYEDTGDGWILSSIPGIPGAFSQGRTRDEARDMVLEALQLMLSNWPDDDLSETETESIQFLRAS